MRHLDEYRDPAAVHTLIRAIHRRVTRPWTLMEICGGQTHTLLRSGLDRMLPDGVTLVHGPGCPVCVTPIEQVDRAIAIAGLPGVILASFGDMLRVPGTGGDLLRARAGGADVRIVYSPLDAVTLARRHPQRPVVFFAVGFETTAPANAMAVRQAAALGLDNFSILCAQVRVPPAIETILQAPDAVVQGLLAPGHVCAVTGYEAYEAIAARHRVPIVVTGFEPVDLAEGVYRLVVALEEGRIGVENAYARAVGRRGNLAARALIAEVFEGCDRAWRGLGTILDSGLALRPRYACFDAARRFDVGPIAPGEASPCIAGLVLCGRRKPPECPAFGTACTPERPLGAPMVSGEGACAAYYRYAGATT